MDHPKDRFGLRYVKWAPLPLHQAPVPTSKVSVLTVWNGSPGDGRAGNANAVRAWRKHGYELVVIDISKLRETNSR